MNELLRRLLCLPPQASTVARGVDTLHYAVIGTTLLGACGVFAAAVYFVLRYPYRPGATTARVAMPAVLEVAFVGGTLGLFLVFWVVGDAQYNRIEHPPRDALEVVVTAKQWVWKFAYADGRGAAGTLTVPLGRPVRLVMTSRDAIHSFYVPAFRIKQDVLPGRYTTAWFEATRVGVYDVLCAEYCGLSHSNMHAQVVVLAPPDYALWLARTGWRGGGGGDDRAADSEAPFGASGYAWPRGRRLADIGREVAVRRACMSCHTADGQRHIGPTWRGLFGARVRLADGRTLTADEAYLTRSMMDPMADLVAGFPPVMPTYRGVVTAPEAAALVEYIRALESEGDAPSVALPEVVPAARDAGSEP